MLTPQEWIDKGNEKVQYNNTALDNMQEYAEYAIRQHKSQPGKPEIIRALWWKQPYASLMLHDKIETRKYPTNVRGKVLICACKKRYEPGEIMMISGRRQFNRMDLYLENNEAAILGMALAIGDLTMCYPMQDNELMESQCFVEYKKGLWCWRFENVKPIQPFEIKGKQGWAILNEETISKIKTI